MISRPSADHSPLLIQKRKAVCYVMGRTTLLSHQLHTHFLPSLTFYSLLSTTWSSSGSNFSYCQTRLRTSTKASSNSMEGANQTCQSGTSTVKRFRAGPITSACSFIFLKRWKGSGQRQRRGLRIWYKPRSHG